MPSVVLVWAARCSLASSSARPSPPRLQPLAACGQPAQPWPLRLGQHHRHPGGRGGPAGLRRRAPAGPAGRYRLDLGTAAARGRDVLRVAGHLPGRPRPGLPARHGRPAEPPRPGPRAGRHPGLRVSERGLLRPGPTLRRRAGLARLGPVLDRHWRGGGRRLPGHRRGHRAGPGRRAAQRPRRPSAAGHDHRRSRLGRPARQPSAPPAPRPSGPDQLGLDLEPDRLGEQEPARLQGGVPGQAPVPRVLAIR